MIWLRVQMALLDAAGAVAAFAANWLLQSTLLIGAGLLVAWLARRRGAAVQSAIYRTTLAAVVVCPLATLLLSLNGVSGWSLPMPVAWSYEELISPPLEDASKPEVAAAASYPASETQPSDFDGAIQAGREQRVEPSAAHHAGDRWSDGESAFSNQPSMEDGGSGGPPLAASLVPPSAQSTHTIRAPVTVFQVYLFGFVAIAIAVAWLLGTTLLVVRLTFAWRRLNRLMVAAAPADSAVQEACRQAAALVGVAAPKVLSSPYLASPCLAGWSRAAVLLPEVTPALPLRDVLIHELAHLRRGDAGWNLIARLTEALFFYQPLVWLLSRRLEASAEEVCDDYVVQFGGDRSQYARGLLEIAELVTTPVSATAVAMVSLRSILARRVTRIMDSSRSLSTRAGNLLLALVIAGGLTAATIVGFVGLAPHSPADAAIDEVADASESSPKTSEPVAKTEATATADEAAGRPSAGSSTDVGDDLIVVSGQVVDPQGKPFTGAKLYAVRWYWEPHIPHPPLAETASGANGKFTISYRKSQFAVDVGRMDQWKEVAIVATADGFGPGWVTWRDIPRSEQPTLRLVTDDAPIVGRVVDLEGKPVAGVAVRVGSIYTGKGGNLDAWLEAVRRGEFPWTAAKHLDDDLPQFDGWPLRIATDNDGRFRINGLGRERRVNLSFSGPAIAYQEVEAVTRHSDIFPLKFSRSEREFGTVYGAEVELVAPPTQPITGIVRDAETRQPLAGVSIESNMFAGSNFINTRQLRAVSDEQGRYRLVGMPKGAGNRILAVPNDDQPYLMRGMKLPESRGLEPVQIDIELHRGIWITGRITDLRTGAPLMARLHYLPFRSNQYAQKTPEFGELGTADGFQERYVSRPDGSYRLVGLPGRAIIGAQCELGHYRKGVGAENIAGMNEYGHFETYFNPIEPGKKWPNAMKEINPTLGTETVVCDLALDPGEKLTVNVLDPDGKPLEGFETQGSGQSWSDSHDLHGNVDVITLGPEETRTVVIRHKDRRLGKVIRVKLADLPSGSLSVTLEPTGRIVGRLVDQQGTPISGAAIEALVLPTGDFSERLPSIATDAQGHFEYTEIPTGCPYDLNAEAASMKPGGWFAKDVALEPGETKDLGDVVYGSAAQGNKSADVKQPSEPAENTETRTEKKQARADSELRGRVIGSDGKPVAGAKLYWIRARVHDLKPQPPQLLATTGDDGKYHFAEPPAVEPTVPASWGYRDRVVVVATGHGFAFTSPGEIRQNMATPDGVIAALARAATGHDSAATTLPASGEPIRGRLVDVNGQPVAGAKVRIRWFNGEKDVWGVADLEARGIENARWHARAGNLLDVIEEVQLRDVLPAATTNDDGRFELHDIGQKRLVQLLVQGEGIEATEIVARNEPGEKIVIKSDRHQRGGSFTVYPDEFVFVVGPSRPVEGRVLDLDTGEPIAGAVVRASQVHNEPVMTSREREHFAATTDAQGRYRIAGLPIGKGNNLVAFATGNVAYLPVAQTADTSGEGAAITRDFRLKRGVWAEGRVFDAESQKAFTGEISYYFFRSREQEEAIPGLRDAYVDGLYWTDANGEFRVPVLPSRGILAFRYDGYDRERDGIDRFPRGFGADEIAGSEEFGGGKQFPTEPHYLIPENYERVAEVAPVAGQDTIRVDMPLFASPPVTVRVEAEGEPLTKFEAYGNERWQWQQHDGPEFQIVDLKPGERRKVFVFHRGRNLAGGGFVAYGAKEAVRIELVKAGSVKGRLVDGDGEPIDDAMLFVNYEKLRSGDNSAIWANGPGLVANPTKIPVDKNGRFRLDGLIPGWTYHAYASAPRPYQGQMMNRVIGTALKGVQVNAGEVKDLGDLVVGDDKSGSDKQQKDASSAKPASQQRKEPEEKQYQGKVVDADGRPLVGAEIWFAVSPHDHVANTVQSTLRRVAVSDLRGDFSFRLKPPENADQFPTEWTRFATIVAKAPNHGFDWLPLVVFEQDAVSSERRIKLQQELDKRLGPGRFAGRVLELPREARPVRGRLVDLQGRPLKGVAVMLESIQSPDSVLLREGFEKASPDIVSKALHAPALSQGWLGRRNWQALIPPVKTNGNGEFSLAGLGRDQVATVTLSGERVEAERFFIVGTEMETKRVPHISLYPKGAQDSFVGVDFSLAVGPAIPVSGVVTEFKTGKPIAGVVVHVERLFSRESLRSSSSRLRLSTSHIRAVTDEQGRYRLDGIPPGEAHVLNAIPPTTEPWLIAKQTISLGPGQSNAAVNIQVFRGIWIEGKVTDADTGEAIKGRVDYLALRTNKNIPQEFGLEDGWEMGRFPIGAEGRYRTAGLPGPGVLFVSGSSGNKVYPLGVGVEKIEGYDAERRYLPTTPTGWPISNWNLLQFIDPKVGVESHHCDLTLSAGGSLAGRIVGLNDAPGAAIEAMGLVEKNEFFKPLKDDKFTVTDYRPDVPRNLFFRTSDQSLIGYLHLEGKPPADLTVRLQPSVMVRGSLIETENEEPAAGYRIYCDSSQQGKFRVDDVATDKEGRFEIKGLMAGNVYKMDSANVQRFISHKNGFTIDLTDAKPGDVIELGDVTGKNAKRIPAAPEQSDSSDEAKKASSDRPGDANTVRGRVVDAKDQPVVGARVRVYRNYWLSAGGTVGAAPDPGWLADTRSDANGRFSAEFKPLSSTAESQAKSRGFSQSIGVFATAEGFGFALRQTDPAANDELELRLVPDSSPIEGRLLDLEGRPVRGARVTVRAVDSFDEDPQTLDNWLAEVRDSAAANGEANQLPGGRTVEFDSFFHPFPVATTDAEGRFTVTGIGADRVAYLEIEGAKIATIWLPVVTRPIEPLSLANGHLRFPDQICYLRFSTQTCYGARCEVVAAPEQPIQGVVRDADTGRPLPETEVRLDWNDNAFSQRGLATKTDAEGGYRLLGLPKPPGEGREVELRVVAAAGQPYFRTEVKVPRGRGVDAVTCNVPLRRGVALRGRVTDRKTGQPVRAAVRYYPFLTNQAAAQYANFDPGVLKLGDDDRYATDAEGRFVIPAVVGRGVLTVAAEQGDRYTLADGADAIADLALADQRRLNVYHLAGLNQDNAVREVDIPADAREFALEVQLAPLPVTSLLLVDRDGNEISGVETQGLVPMNPFHDHWSHSWRDPLARASAELVGPEAGETRETLFLDRARNLGAMVRFTSESIGGERTKRIVLQPCGSIRGRIVDAGGMPVAGAWVGGEVVPGGGKAPVEENVQPALRDRRFAWRLTLNLAHADADGRFELKGVPPGARYAVGAFAEKRGERWQAVTAEIKPGATVELGDVAPKAEGKQESAAEAPATAIQAAEQTIVRGQVLDPEGHPLAGAALLVRSAVFDEDGPPLKSTVSDLAGHFEFSFHWPEFDERTENEPDLMVVANADGLAPDWTYLRKDESPREITLNLAQEKTIAGRIVNEEGRPLAGVELKAETIARYDAETMKTVLDDVSQGRNLLRMGKTWHYGALSKRPARVTTAADGRFRIGGLSSNTVVELHVRGAGTRETRFNATTATPDTIRGPVPPVEPPYGPRAGAVLYGSDFDYVAEPGRRVQGTVRDRETKRPVAKANVMIYQPTAALRGGNDRLSAETDDAGHYVIDGCAKNSRVGLNVDPPTNGPAYFPAALPIEDAPGLAEVVQNVDLVRGIELRGRIVDDETGQPLIASLHYAPLYLNKYAAPLYEQEADLRSHTRSAADGSFRLAVAPGPGAVEVSRPSVAPEDYMNIRVSYEDVVELFEASPSHRELAHSPDLKRGLPDSLPTQGRGGWSFIGQIDAARMNLICPEEQKPPEPLEVRLVRGRSIRGKVVDADRQPLAGARAYLNNPGIIYRTLSTAEFTVSALARGEKRDIAFRHDKHRAGAFRTISADEAEPLIVRLEPFASVQGRVLDEQGAPIEGLHVWFYRAGHITSEELFAVTDADGRFRIDKLIPNQPYEVMRTGPGSMTYRQFSPQKLIFSVPSGKTHQLADLVVKGPVQTISPKGKTDPAVDDTDPPNSKKPANSPANAEGADDRARHEKGVTLPQAAKEKIVRGRVLLPDGKPAAGAELYWVRIASTERRSAMTIDKRGATDADGRFRFDVGPSDLPATPVPISLVAQKAGFGVAWREIARDDVPRDVALQLVDDLPIRGHLIDTEGRPVAGASVSVGSLLASNDDNLDAFLLAWKRDWRFAWTKLDEPRALYAPLGGSLSVTTDRDGRFELSGVGVERVATLDIKANGYAYDQLQVPTRENFEPQPYNEAARSLFPRPPAPVRGMIAKLAGPKFEHVMTAELVVRGKVFTGDQRPVAGANVNLDQFGYAPIVAAVTDAAGRYELRGQPRGVRAGVSVYAPESTGLLGRSLQRDTQPTQSTLEIDVRLNRGLVLKGRVFDRSSGKGVRAGLRFVSLPDNDFVGESDNEDPSTGTNDAGEFRMLVMPGPGVLMAQAHDGLKLKDKEVKPYRQASFSKSDSKRVPTTVSGDDRYFTSHNGSIEFLMTENAVKVIDLKPDGGPATCDLALDPGKTAKITIEDGEGQPVTGAFISGLEDSGGAFRIAAPTCTVLALGADRPRRVCVLHPERRLAAAITLTGGEQGPVKVRLAASASISGRAFAPDGQPLADALVQINYDRRSASDLQHHLNLEREVIKTDADGKFHVDNIVPGERFALDFKQGETFFRAPVIPLLWDKRALSAGQKLDLGDVTVR